MGNTGTTNDTTTIGSKIMRPTFVGGPDSGRTRKECWGATSTCGTWKYDREDAPGTPWTITHIPTGRTLAATSLLAARRWTGSGNAVEEICRQLIRIVDTNGMDDGTGRTPQVPGWADGANVRTYIAARQLAYLRVGA